jgi:hypothetical protein
MNLNEKTETKNTKEINKMRNKKYCTKAKKKEKVKKREMTKKEKNTKISNL